MINNPWLGLLSYGDPQKSKESYAFCGRDAAISSLFAMVDNNLLVTLYGKTGIGKTSVLNAGVFPILRSRGYMPISIRLGKYSSTAESSFAKNIVSNIEDEIKSIGGKIETIYPDYSSTNNSSVDFLWKYFGTSVFKDNKGQEVYPVIALDQLEEIFIKQPKESETLLMQIHALMDDNREMPDLDGFNEATNFRFIFSIREDDLFYLEDCIDLNHLAEMKQNRYRLLPLSNQEAKEVIMIGKDYLEKGVEDEIVAKIIRLSKDGNGLISTNILSLVCSQLFSQYHGHISLNDVADDSKNPLDAFYISCISNISDNSRKYIEENLVDADRRKFVNKGDFVANVKDDVEMLMSGQYKIVQDVTAGNRECVELIHDSLARTIYHLKTEAAERERNEKLRRHNRRIKYWGIALVCALFIAIGFIISLALDNQKYQDEKGYGFSQKIAIGFQEDSLIVAERELWRGKLLVLGTADNSIDTLLDRNINDFYRDSTLYVTLDSAKNVRFILNYDKALKNYHPIDTTFTIGQLTDSPSVKLFIHKIVPNLITYSSKVVTVLNGEEVNIQEAIVIVRDRIHRTDVNGLFTIKLEDSLNVNDVIYIVKRGFSCYESKDLIDNAGKFIPKFTIATADSLGTFTLECERVNATEWFYSTSKINPQALGEKVRDGNDKVVFNANKISGKRTNDGNFVIEGYYYFVSEYKEKGDYAYHFFTGWMDSQNMLETGAAYKVFEVESYDFANNKQKVYGQFHRSGRISGIINDIGGYVAVFGPHIEQ